nr:hypothetical protein [Tanacetum cinerariifolium]
QTHPFLVVSGVGVAVVMETVAVDSGVVWWRYGGCCHGGAGGKGAAVGDGVDWRWVVVFGVDGGSGCVVVVGSSG